MFSCLKNLRAGYKDRCQLTLNDVRPYWRQGNLFLRFLKAGLTEDSEARNEDSLRIGDTFNHENQGDENVRK